jgi:signal peptidase II
MRSKNIFRSEKSVMLKNMASLQRCMTKKRTATTKKILKGKILAKPNATAKKEQHKRFWPYGLLLFALLLAADQYTKSAIRASLAPGVSMKIWPFLWFSHIQNTGAVWGSLQNTNDYIIWLTVIAFGLLIYYYDRFTTIFEKVAYTLLLTGLWGNLLDRVLLGHVVDFIDLGWWPAFNIADSCITIGIAVYLLEAWRAAHSTMRT